MMPIDILTADIRLPIDAKPWPY